MSPTFSRYLVDHGHRQEESAEWLQLLVGDWQLVADLLRADLVLWVEHEGTLTAAAHCRPADGSTVYYEDPVGMELEAEFWQPLADTLATGRLDMTPIPVEREDRHAECVLVPVHRDGSIEAVLAVERVARAAGVDRTLNEERMSALGERLLKMIHEGRFPIVGAPIPPRRGAPRVGDGVIELDEQGVVQWASPNALSAFHRFGVDGEMIGETLAEHSTRVIQSRIPVDESLPLVLSGRAAWRSDMQARGGTLSLRAIPLVSGGRRDGAIVLVRDVTELRRRERELITKDATIREVHHRVKNNLQTVAALLRLQSRRIRNPEAREALGEAMRRVSTIALVHEALLQGTEETVFFDDVIDRCMTLAVDVASASVRHSDSEPLSDGIGQVTVRTERFGKVGLVRAEEATPLALVVTELATNAVEHGLAQTGGTLSVRAERTGSHLVLSIEDDGTGIGSRKPEGLGTNIARTLVSGELGGTLTWADRPEGGTQAKIDVYLDPLPLS
ncbi:sensor histidine kinase [Devriesea agamarum]|uniref:sensor histidine kinase n=1 Tax=Devriesea agamarum TaxID=472569 RepID=UPI00071D5837|nr:PAS domain-containing sensor histidine kinase [Devriesea agamarum]